DSSMSVRTKVGLGFTNRISQKELGWDDSAFSVFTTTSEDVEGRPTFYRFPKTDSMKAVPLPLTGDYTSLSDHTDLDESQMSYGPTVRPQPVPTGKPKVYPVPTGKPKFTPVPTGRPHRPFPVATDRGCSPSVPTVQKQTAFGKDILNSLMADNLLKNCMVFNSPYYSYEELASPEQTATVPTGRYVVHTGRYVVLTGRVIVPAGRYIVPAGSVIVATGMYIVPA
nr:ribonuclease H-like domain, Gag-pre-integrase domain protein [Tanacetum cinerariifolium]